jgi:hypothetical protein
MFVNIEQSLAGLYLLALLVNKPQARVFLKYKIFICSLKPNSLERFSP